MQLDQNKRGNIFPFEIIVAIVIILLSGYALVEAVSHTASKIDEKLPIKLCRTLNEIKFGLREKTSDLLGSGESICYTIAKHKDEKTFVPKSEYKQDKEGAELEIREMIKNCWYMWLDGSQEDTFKGYPFSEPCFACYTFKIKEKAKGVTYTSLKKSMEDPLYAKDASDQCSLKGGYWRSNKCDLDEEETEPSNKFFTSSSNLQNTNFKCCIKIGNECENRGGRCSSQGSLSAYSGQYGLYDKWKCPKAGISKQNCYVNKDNVYSYTNYIKSFGSRGGDIFFVPAGNEQAMDINYVPGEIYAISFVSPRKPICWSGEEGLSASCIAKVGGYGIVGLAATAGSGILLAKTATVGGVLTVISSTGITGGFVAWGTYELGIIKNLVKNVLNLGSSLVESKTTIPNFIVVSTQYDAEKKLGCNFKYAE